MVKGQAADAYAARPKTTLVAALGLPAASLAAQALRQGEEAVDHHWAAASEAGAQFLQGPREGSGKAAASCSAPDEPSSFWEATAVPRAARLEVVAIGDSTRCSLKDRTVTVPAPGTGPEFSKECVVKCANGGSLMMRGQEPSAPALTELRHLVEYEPDDRRLHWLSYPLTGGKYRSPEFGAAMKIDHRQVFPETYRFDKLAELWEDAFPAMRAFETDGVHPKESFALYLIGNAMVEMERVYPEFSKTRVGMPLVIVLADGWNHLEGSRDRAELYKRIKAEPLDITTVGGLKQNYPRWRQDFYHFCSKKKRVASWESLELLLAPMESTWAGYNARGAVAIRAPEIPVERIRIDTPSNSDSEPEVTGAAEGVPDAEEVENEKWGRWSLLIMRVQAVVDQARMALDPKEFEPHGPLRALHFDRRYSLDLSPRSSAKERLAYMRMAMTFYAHAAQDYRFVEDETLVGDIKHLISLETQQLEEFSLGITLVPRQRKDLAGSEVADGYAGLKASLIEVEGWGWLPLMPEEAQRCLREFLRDDWAFVREVTVAASSSATRGKRVLILCSSGAGAWRVASAFGHRPKAQVERFESELPSSWSWTTTASGTNSRSGTKS